MKKNNMKKTGLSVAILSTLYGVNATSYGGDYTVNILMHETKEFQDPWKDRAEFYDATVTENLLGGAATLGDVKWSQMYMGIARPDRTAPIDLNDVFVGIPYFLAVYSEPNIDLSGYPPEGTDEVFANTLNYVYYVYNKAGELLAVIDQGRFTIYDSSSIPDGIYDMQMVVSNSDSSVETEKVEITINNQAPVNIDYNIEVKDDLRAYVQNTIPLEDGIQYIWTLRDSAGLFVNAEGLQNNISEVIDGTVSLDSSVSFDVSLLSTGFYSIEAYANDGKYTKQFEPKFFELSNFAPVHNGYGVEAYDSGAVLPLSELADNDLRRGQVLNIYSSDASFDAEFKYSGLEYITRIFDLNGIMIQEDVIGLSGGSNTIPSTPTVIPSKSISTIGLVDGQYELAHFVSDGVNQVESSERYSLNVATEQISLTDVDVTTSSPLIYDISIAEDPNWTVEGYIINSYVTDIDGNVIEDLGEGANVSWNAQSYGSGDYEILVKVYHPDFPLEAKLMNTAFPTSFDSSILVDGESLFHGFTNTAPTPSPEVVSDFDVFGEVNLGVKVDSIDPEGVSVTYKHVLYSKDTGLEAYSYIGKNKIVNLTSVVPGYYYHVAYVSDVRFTVSSVGEVFEGDEVVTYTPGTGNEIYLYDVTAFNNPGIVASVYGAGRNGYFNIIKTPVAGLNYSDPSTTYEITLRDSSDDSILKNVILTNSEITGNYDGVYNWQELALRDFDGYAELKVTSQGVEYFSAPPVDKYDPAESSTQSFFNIAPYDIGSVLYIKNSTEIKFTDETRNYYYDNKYDGNPLNMNIVVSDLAGNVVFDGETQSFGFPFIFDSTQLADGAYKIKLRSKDYWKYSPFTPEMTINVINTPIVSGTVSSSYDDAGYLTIDGTAPTQDAAWDLGTVDYKVKIKRVSDDAIVYTSDLNVIDNIVHIAGYNSDDYEVYMTAYGKSNITQNSYEFEVDGVSSLFSFLNEAPTKPTLDVGYDSKNLSSLVDFITVSSDKEQGIITYKFDIVEQATSNVVDTTTSLPYVVDATLFTSGAYDINITVQDGVNTVTDQLVSAFLVDNQAPSVPSINTSQEGVNLLVQMSGAIDFENKPLTYKVTAIHPDPLIDDVVENFSLGNLKSLSLETFTDSDITIFAEVTDGVNTVSQTKVVHYNNTLPIFDSISTATKEKGSYVFRAFASDLEQDNLEYTFTLNDPNGTLMFNPVTNNNSVLGRNYTHDWVEGTYSLNIKVNDGVNEVEETVSFDYYNELPIMNSHNVSQNNMMMKIDFDVTDADFDLVNKSIYIKNSSGDILFTKSTRGNTIYWDAKEQATGTYYFDLILNDGLGETSNLDFPFDLINSAPPQPNFTYSITGLYDMSLIGIAVSDPEKQPISYRYDVYENSVLIRENFASSLVKNVDLSTFVTGSYDFVLVASDGVNESMSKPQTVGVQNEGPGTPVFTTLQDNFDLDMYGGEYIDPEGIQLEYTYVATKIDEPAVSYTTTGIENIQSFYTETWPVGKYSLNLSISDGANVAESPTTFVNISNLAPMQPDILATVYDSYIDIRASLVSDPEFKQVNYDIKVYNVNDLITPVAVSVDREFSIPTNTLGGSGEYIIKVIVDDGIVFAEETTKNFTFENSAPSKSVFTAAFGNDSVDMIGSAAFDSNLDVVNYYYEFVLTSDSSSYIFNDGADLGRNKTINYNELVGGNGQYMVTLFSTDGYIDVPSDPYYFELNYSPMISAAFVNVVNYFAGIEFDPGQEISLTTSYDGNTDNDLVNYNWSVLDGTLQVAGYGDDTNKWILPTSHGEHTITVSMTDTETTTPVVGTATVTVKNYPPEQQDIILANVDGVFDGTFENVGTSTVPFDYWNTLTPSTSFISDGTVSGLFNSANELGYPVYNPGNEDMKILTVNNGSYVTIDMKQNVIPVEIGMTLANTTLDSISTVEPEFDVLYSYDGITYNKITSIMMYPGKYYNTSVDLSYDTTFVDFPGSNPFTKVQVLPENMPLARYWKIQKVGTKTMRVNVYFKF